MTRPRGGAPNEGLQQTRSALTPIAAALSAEPWCQAFREAESMFLLGDAERHIERGRKSGAVEFVAAVGQVLDGADFLHRWLARGRAALLYEVVAGPDIDDRLITEAVDHARRRLEARGVPCLPSIERLAQEDLQSMPEFDREVMLARRAVSSLASGLRARQRASAVALAVRHFEAAMKHGRLSRRDSRVLDGLRGEQRA